nr:MAG TPA: hypothetical protein [Caudoviricetes sp.]
MLKFIFSPVALKSSRRILFDCQSFRYVETFLNCLYAIFSFCTL